MTISIDTNQWPLVGDGVSVNIIINNQVFAAADLIVNATQDSTGARTLQVLNVDYTVAIAGDRTAVVTMTTAPAVGVTVVVVCDTKALYSDQFEPRKAFADGSLNNTLDRIYRAVHRITAQINRTFRLGDGDPATSMAPAATISTFFGKYVAIDGSGNPVPGVTLTGQVVTYTKNAFSGDNATVAFTLSAAPASAEAAAVYISGVRQVPTADFTVSGTTLTFTSAPPTGTNNIFVLASQSFAGVPSDGSVTSAKIAAGAVLAAAIGAGAIVEAGIGADAVDWLTKIKAATAGDLPVFDASGDPALLAKGTALQELRMNAGATALEYFTPGLSKVYTSTEQTITSGGALTLAHGLGAQPTLVLAELICKTAEFGYVIGDIVPIYLNSQDGSNALARGVAVIMDATNLKLRFGATTISFSLINFSSGAVVTPTLANWKLVMRAWA